MGFLERLFGKKEELPQQVRVVEEPFHFDAYQNNKLVRFKSDDNKWASKLAIVLSREEPTEKQLREVYKKDVPFFYKVAVEQEDKFLQLKLVVSHLRLGSVSQEDLSNFKKTHTSIKLTQESGTEPTINELTTKDEVDKWNELLKENHKVM